MTSVDPRALPAAAASVATDVRAQKPQHLRRNPFGDVLIYLILLASASLVLGPFALSFMTAFKSPQQFASESSLALPNPWTTENFARLFGGDYGFVSPIVVTAQVVAVILVGQLLFSVMAAYAFARLRWPGRNLVFGVFLGALLVPPIFTSLPNFILIKNLGLLNTLPGMVLPAFLMTPFAIFFLRQFFLGINREIEEAAMIDGAGPWRIFFRIILPISTAPITTLAILTFIATWNDYFWPLLVGNTDQTKVLTVALGVFRSQTPAGSPDWAGLMAATLLTALPVLILFFAFARKIIDSIGYSGSK